MYAAPAAADALGDLKVQVEQLQERIRRLEKEQEQQAKKATAAEVPGQGSFPNSFVIPGTKTSMRLGGYVKADLIYDVNQSLGDFIQGFRFSVDPGDRAQKGHLVSHAEQSRITVETRTPTPGGAFRTYIETDFFGGERDDLISNTSFLRIRQAFGEYRGFLAGQAWSNFMDLRALPEHLEFNGPVGYNFLRQGQLRYTAKLDGATTVSVSAENPVSDIVGTTRSNHLPDLTARVAFGGSWGGASVAGVLRQFNRDTRDGNGGGSYTTATGWGLGVGGVLKLGGKDNLKFMASYGKGIGRYIENSAFQAGGVNADGDIVVTASYGGYLAFQHWWTDAVRTNLIAGQVRNKNIAANLGGFATSPGDGGPSDLLRSFHGNVVWSPIKPLDLGVEYVWGYRERPVVSDGGGLKGNLGRVQASAKYSF
jgi:hypothetical protein